MHLWALIGWFASRWLVQQRQVIVHLGTPAGEPDSPSSDVIATDWNKWPSYENKSMSYWNKSLSYQHKWPTYAQILSKILVKSGTSQVRDVATPPPIPSRRRGVAAKSSVTCALGAPLKAVGAPASDLHVRRLTPIGALGAQLFLFSLLPLYAQGGRNRGGSPFIFYGRMSLPFSIGSASRA